MNKLTKLLVGALLITFTSSALAVDFSGSVGYANDYIWRGMSKSNGERIFTGSATLSLDNGLYTNAAFYNGVDFPSATAEENELDYTVGFAKDLTDEVSIDVGWTRHTYIGDDNDAVNEMFGSLGYGPANVTVYRLIGNDVDSAAYIVGAVSITDILKIDNVPVNISTFYGTQLAVEDDGERVNDFGVIASKTFRDRLNVAYKYSHWDVTEEGTHSVGVNIVF